MKTINILIIFFCIVTSITGQVIPEDKRINWSVSGYIGDFPDPVNIVSVMDFGASTDGSSDNYSAIINAINSLNDEAGIIYFPSGTYKVNTGFTIPENVIIRGAGPKSSTLIFDFESDQNGITISGSSGSLEVNIIGGNLLGSTQLTVEDGSGFSAGDYALTSQDNGDWDTNPADWAVRVTGQIVIISAVSGNILSLETPLRLDYDLDQNMKIIKINPIRNVGIEDIGIETINDPGGSSKNISFSYAANCWIKNIESNKSVSSHVGVTYSTNIEIRDSYFYDAFTFTGEGERGYGVSISNQVGLCLIENNIFRHLRHSMMVKNGASGNVFAYNYSIDPTRIEDPIDLSACISIHGHFPFSNLFEGNIVQNIVTDHFWGANGPFNTFFRNKIELYGVLFDNNTVDATKTTNKQNYVGNEITNTDFFKGQFSTTGTDHFLYGNNIRGTINPVGTETLNDNSYYLLSSPDFWNISDNWPSIGIPNVINTGSIPARERYLEMISGISKINKTQEYINIYPNPCSSGRLYFDLGKNNFNKVVVRLFDQIGSEIQSRVYNNNSEYVLSLDLFDQPKGVYLLNIEVDNNNYKTKKLILIH